MGTNYYVQVEDVCPHCGRGGELKHIGKSSVAWCFSLHVYPDEGINNLEDWQKIWEGKEISDEYGNVFTSDEMFSGITERGRVKEKENKPYGYNSWAEFHDMNHSEQGPNNLLRHRIDGWHCIGHGDGTYDFIIGDFS